MKSRRKKIILTIVYVIACYCSRIPGYFIDWQKGLPPESSPPGFTEGIFNFILAPILAPVALVVETFLAFAWGKVMFERLLPLSTFTIVAIVIYIFLNRTLHRKQINSEN